MKKFDLYDYLQDENLYRNEGERGIKNLNEVAKRMGYKEEGFAYGSSFETFLQDNPGCHGAIIEWINNNMTDDWKEGLEAYGAEKEDNDDEEDSKEE